MRHAFEFFQSLLDAAAQSRRHAKRLTKLLDGPGLDQDAATTQPLLDSLAARTRAFDIQQAIGAIPGCQKYQAVVEADGSQPVLATHVTRSPFDAPSFAAVVLGMAGTMGLPERVLADAGFASASAVGALRERGVDPLVAIARTQPCWPYDFRPPPDNPKPKRTVSAPWRVAMQERMQTDEARAHYRKRNQAVESVFGIIKSAIGFRRFSLRGLVGIAAEWTLVTLAYNCRRMTTLIASA